MIKEHMYMHRAYMHHVYMHQSQGLSMHDKYAASWIHPSYTHVSGSRIIDVCITHVYMYQGPGSKGTYTCIIHACIRIMYKCTRHASYICASWPRVSGSRIYASNIHTSLDDQGACIYVSWIHASCIHTSRSKFVHPTPRIALFVRPSVRNKICRIEDTCTIHTCMLRDQGPGS